jgi:hypothetical protein
MISSNVTDKNLPVAELMERGRLSLQGSRKQLELYTGEFDGLRIDYRTGQKRSRKSLTEPDRERLTSLSKRFRSICLQDSVRGEPINGGCIEATTFYKSLILEALASDMLACYGAANGDIKPHHVWQLGLKGATSYS